MQETITEKSRLWNMDLLRILSIFMVISLHFLLHGNVLDSVREFSVQYYLVWIIEALCIVPVNCFILLSGYFQIESKFSVKKLLQLVLEVLFYSVIIYLLAVLFEKEHFSLFSLFRAFTPTLSGEYWFFSCYIVTYLLSPFLNKMLKSLTSIERKRFMLVIILVFSILPSVFFYNSSLNFGGGFGVAWFLVMYCCGAYIRLSYQPKENNFKYLVFYFVSSLSVACIRFLVDIVLANNSILSDQLIFMLRQQIYNYNFILIVVSSISLFLFFVNLQIKHVHLKLLISKLAPLTFGIYLIHDNQYIRNVLWSFTNSVENPSSLQIITLLFSAVFLIYCGSCLIDFVRKEVFETRLLSSTYFNKLLNKIGQ